ncbi:MAG: hypothetical protein RBT74_07690 [Tenuifilaceae bacterium]|jgi:hypothetical protein|nr:hypothetical protein [Tenuifilaceae bacterium]
MRLQILLIPLYLLTLIEFSQGQTVTFTAPGSKQGRIKVTTGRIENNEFSMLLQVEWLDTKMKPIDDKKSHVVFSKSDVKLPGNGNIVCKSFEESNSSSFYFNSSLKLNFVIKEDAELKETNFGIDFPFMYSNSLESALKPNEWVSFMAKSPRNFLAQLTINPDDIKDLSAPKITVLSPEGVTEGFRSQVLNKELEVKVLVKDRNKVRNVRINDVIAIPLNDTVYIAKVQLSRVGGTYSIKIFAEDASGNVGQNEFFVETKSADDISSKLFAEQKKKSRNDFGC